MFCMASIQAHPPPPILSFFDENLILGMCFFSASDAYFRLVQVNKDSIFPAWLGKYLNQAPTRVEPSAGPINRKTHNPLVVIFFKIKRGKVLSAHQTTKQNTKKVPLPFHNLNSY